jgi:hypothetical protein
MIVISLRDDMWTTRADLVLMSLGILCSFERSCWPGNSKCSKDQGARGATR